MKSYRVFAESQNGPEVTVRDALSWTVGYEDTDEGPEIMGKPLGDYWRVGFSENAIQSVIAQLEGEADGDLLNVVIESGWEIAIKAPSGKDTPEIVWVYAEEQDSSVFVAACVVDEFEVSQVLFKPSLDAEGQEMTLIPGGAGVYTIELPDYAITVQEVIQATNDREKPATRTLSLPVPPTVEQGLNVITSKYSNRCATVRDASEADGANVAQQLYKGGTSQIWVLEYLGDGYYKIVNKHSGKVLEVADGRTGDYVNVQQNAWTDADYQKWRIEPLGDGYFSIIAKHSGKCLDVEMSTADLANIRQLTYRGFETQKWIFQVPESYPSQLIDYYAFTARHSGMVAEVAVDTPSDGAFITQNEYAGGANQEWELRPVGDGYFSIVARGSGKYLGFTGSDVRQWDSTGGDDQKWKFVLVDGSYYEIVNKQTDFCWSVESGGTAAGTKVVLQEYGANDWEKFKLYLWVKVTVDRVVCTMADDEGPSNNPDMDRFHVWANAFNRTGIDDEPGVQFNPEDQTIWYWSTSGSWTVGKGGSMNVGKWIYLGFDADNYDFNAARLKLACYAREDDPTGADEQGTGYTTIHGESFFDQEFDGVYGEHDFYVSSADFRFRIEMEISRSWR
jgi:hypothetical protein